MCKRDLYGTVHCPLLLNEMDGGQPEFMFEGSIIKLILA